MIRYWLAPTMLSAILFIFSVEGAVAEKSKADLLWDKFQACDALFDQRAKKCGTHPDPKSPCMEAAYLERRNCQHDASRDIIRTRPK